MFDDFEQTLKPDFAGLGIDVGADVAFRAVARAGGLLDRVGHGGQNDFAVDHFFARDGIRDLQKFEPVSTHCHIKVSV